MKHCFYNPQTQYDPAYRNVQAELWQLLTAEEQKMVAGEFRHLKNHAQIAVSEALIDYIEEGIEPTFGTEDFLYAAVFIKLTGYSLSTHQPTDIRPRS